MKLFEAFGNELSYKDILQLDGAFSAAHINYGKSPIFHGIDSKNIAKNSRKNSLSSNEKIENVIDCIHSFDGTEKNFKKADQILLWKIYWMEYINAFDQMVDSLPDSVVTISIGRQAVEIGFKYLLLVKNEQIPKTHDLEELSDLFYSIYNISDCYMEDVDSFCKMYGKFIEGGNVEYFRFPEYKANTYFAGNRLDIRWLSYNFALIILKLIHFADLETEM